MRDFKVFVDDKCEEILEHLKSIGYNSENPIEAYSFVLAKDGSYKPCNLNLLFQESPLPRLTADEVLALKAEPKFKPFDKVLVRGSNSSTWQATMFSKMNRENYICVGLSVWSQCIPYEGNEHLHGTNKNPE